MQKLKLKYYTVCLTVVLTTLFLSYPNITLPQTPSTQNEVYNNYERAKGICERNAGRYIEETSGADIVYRCIVEPRYDVSGLEAECQNLGGTFTEDRCQIEPKIAIAGLEEKCWDANGKWEDGYCSFEEVLSQNCVLARGTWTNGQCEVISEKTAFFTHELRGEIEEGLMIEYGIPGLHKIIFHTEEDFYLRIEREVSILETILTYSRQRVKESIYGVKSDVPGICLHPSAQQGGEWTSSEGPCVDPSGTDIGDSIWIIFSQEDNHGFKFTRSEEAEYYEGRNVHFYYLETILIDDSDMENGQTYMLSWSTPSGNRGMYQFADPEGMQMVMTEPGPRIRLKFDISSLRSLENVQLSDKTKRDFEGVAPN